MAASSVGQDDGETHKGFEQRHEPTAFDNPGRHSVSCLGSMDHPDDHAVLSELDKLREALQAEVTKLSKQRKELKAQLKELGGKLKGVDTELEAKQRMLRLVKATAQDLGRQQGGLDESGQDHLSVEARIEVRGKGVYGGVRRF
jgi:DNA repair exonuclease SbcCD ATPase subunit